VRGYAARLLKPAQRRLDQKGEGVAINEAASAKEYLNTAMVLFNEIGI